MFPRPLTYEKNKSFFLFGPRGTGKTDWLRRTFPNDLEHDPAAYLTSYVATYLREEVQQEGLTRNLSAFSRFLEFSSFSQAEVLTMGGGVSSVTYCRQRDIVVTYAS